MKSFHFPGNFPTLHNPTLDLIGKRILVEIFIVAQNIRDISIANQISHTYKQGCKWWESFRENGNFPWKFSGNFQGPGILGIYGNIHIFQLIFCVWISQSVLDNIYINQRQLGMKNFISEYNYSTGCNIGATVEALLWFSLCYSWQNLATYVLTVVQ